MRPRNALFGLLLLASGIVWTELSVVSPIHGWARDLYSDLRLGARRAVWKPPCHDERWNPVDLDIDSVPVPACYDVIETDRMNLPDGSMMTVVARDSRSSETALFASVIIVSEKRLPRVRSLPRSRRCTILKQANPMVWSCGEGTREVLIGRKLASFRMSWPGYVSSAQREYLTREFGRVVDEYVARAKPANNSVTLKPHPATARG